MTELSLAAIVEQLPPSEDQPGGRAVRTGRSVSARRTIVAVIRDFPGSDELLLSPPVMEAWQILRAEDPDFYLTCRKVVRDRAGRYVTDLIDAQLASPQQARLSRDIVLLSPAELQAQPTMLDLIRGILPAQGVAAFVSAPGGGKSFCCLHIVLSCAADLPPIPGRRYRRTAGVIVSAEGRQIGRLKAFALHNGVDVNALPVRFIEQSIDLGNPAADVDALLERLTEAAGEIGQIGIVVVDTLAHHFGAGVENDTQDMSRFMANMARISEHTGGLTIVAHHFGKDQSRGGRGNNAFLGALDAQIDLTRQEDGLRIGKVTKLRDGEDGVEFAFRLEPVDLGPHPDPDADQDERWTSCVVVPADSIPLPAKQARPRKLPAGAQVVLDSLRVAIDRKGEVLPGTSVLPAGVRAVRIDDWQDAYAAMRLIPDGLTEAEQKKEKNTRRMGFKRGQDELQAARQVGTGAGFWWIP